MVSHKDHASRCDWLVETMEMAEWEGHQAISQERFFAQIVDVAD